MRDRNPDEEFRALKNHFNPPPDTPRDEMWEAIQARIATEAAGAADEDPKGGAREGAQEDVVPLSAARRMWSGLEARPLRWAAAAAAVLVLGVGIGRITAPAPGPGATAEVAADPDVMFAAAVNHLQRTESLLTLVQADARAGRVEPGVATWSRTLLTQTRLLMGTEVGEDPVMADLLEDLELVLVQVLGAANATGQNPGRIRSELNLALDGMNERDVLSRLQAVLPVGSGSLGT